MRNGFSIVHFCAIASALAAVQRLTNELTASSKEEFAKSGQFLDRAQRHYILC
jgi:hypothetical protein